MGTPLLACGAYHHRTAAGGSEASVPPLAKETLPAYCSESRRHFSTLTPIRGGSWTAWALREIDQSKQRLAFRSWSPPPDILAAGSVDLMWLLRNSCPTPHVALISIGGCQLTLGILVSRSYGACITNETEAPRREGTYSSSLCGTARIRTPSVELQSLVLLS